MELKRYIRSAALSASGVTDVGQVRKANEDNCGHASLPYGELFVVCDGMGGHVGGATASRIAVEAIIGRMSQERMPASVPELMTDALRFANDQVLGTAEADPSLKGMGTTACIVLVQGAQAWLAHVGDSRIYLFDAQDGMLHRITRDHSLVQQLVDDGELDDREAEHHPQKNIILSAIGIRDMVRPEVEPKPLPLVRGDRILICSDGLSGMVDDDAIEGRLRESSDTDAVVSALMSEANAPGKGKDNITVQLIDVLEGNDMPRTYKDYNPKWRKSGTASPAKVMTVGRAEDNSFVLARPQVSKHHLEMRQDGGVLTVRDLGSLNGTYVNGVRLQEERRLQRGDKVVVDTVELPWESWFSLPRPDTPERPRSAPGRPVGVQDEQVRRRVEEKLARLKEMIKNK